MVVLDTAWLKALPEAESVVRRAVRAALVGVGASGTVALAVALADDRRVRRLNARDRRQDKPTNVLSYPSGDGRFLGDVVLARGVVRREALAQGKSLSAHLSHLVVHGTLHLLGYDHERSEADAARMEGLERRVLKRIGIADPYRDGD